MNSISLVYFPNILNTNILNGQYCINKFSSDIYELAATSSSMHNIYGKLEFDSSNEKSISFSSLGLALEESLESQGYKVELPTDADWGYVFRSEFDGNSFDISVVSLLDKDFAIAIERSKGLFDSLHQKLVEVCLLKAKEAIVRALETLVTIKSLTWYSTDEWKSEFGWSFWNKPV